MSHTLSFLGLFRYICLTDMIKAKDGDFFISDWLRNRNTLEYIGVWEQMYNPNFNYGEFAIIKSNAGLNNFKISVKEGGEQEQDWMWFAPFGDAFSRLLVVRRFHDLRSFHQRLLKVGPLRGPKVTCANYSRIICANGMKKAC